MSNRPDASETISLPQGIEKPSPEQSKYLALVRQLTESAATLVIKVATCKCDKKDQCKVYLHGQRMADIIDGLQEMREKVSVGPTAKRTEGRAKSGKRRGNV